MAVDEILSQDEIDALLNGVEDGAVDTESEPPPVDGEVRPYDLSNQERIFRGRLPTLEMINERFVRLFRTGMYNMLRRYTQVTAEKVQIRKYGEYISGLLMPTSLNMVRVHPLHGTALFILDPKLVFTSVESFFGGDGRFPIKVEGRDFTPSENRVVQLVLNRAFADMAEAWAPILALKHEFLQSEMNPSFANITTHNELVVISVFQIEVEGFSDIGELHVTMPMTMVDPLRQLLEAGVQADRNTVDDLWATALQEEIKDASVAISSTLASADLTLRDVLELRAGDVIPIELPELVSVIAEDVPVLRGKFGVFRGSNAIKIVEKVERRELLARGAATQEEKQNSDRKPV
ncbi:MAG: flagellar motor switch protein FliM [Pseudomonadota bacterium]|nr:flagellar motor switch protein FliM [Pseudomonadota bacterium]